MCDTDFTPSRTLNNLEFTLVNYISKLASQTATEILVLFGGKDSFGELRKWMYVCLLQSRFITAYLWSSISNRNGEQELDLANALCSSSHPGFPILAAFDDHLERVFGHSDGEPRPGAHQGAATMSCPPASSSPGRPGSPDGVVRANTPSPTTHIGRLTPAEDSASRSEELQGGSGLGTLAPSVAAPSVQAVNVIPSKSNDATGVGPASHDMSVSKDLVTMDKALDQTPARSNRQASAELSTSSDTPTSADTQISCEARISTEAPTSPNARASTDALISTNALASPHMQTSTDTPATNDVPGSSNAPSSDDMSTSRDADVLASDDTATPGDARTASNPPSSENTSTAGNSDAPTSNDTPNVGDRVTSDDVPASNAASDVTLDKPAPNVMPPATSSHSADFDVCSHTPALIAASSDASGSGCVLPPMMSAARNNIPISPRKTRRQRLNETDTAGCSVAEPLVVESVPPVRTRARKRAAEEAELVATSTKKPRNVKSKPSRRGGRR